MDPGTILAVIQLTKSVVKICGKYIREVKDATDEIESLQQEVGGLTDVLQRLYEFVTSPDGKELPTSQKLAIDISNCHLRLAALEEDINPSKRQKTMKKLGLRLRWPLKRDDVERTMKQFERYKSSFILALQITQTSLLTVVDRNISDVDRNINLDKLPVAYGVEFDSYVDQHEDECHPGTRTELLDQIRQWTMSPEGKCIFWLNGMAGTGKSTISRTVARSLKDQQLGASFFFKRGEGDRGVATKLFSTISKQLTRRIPLLIPYVKNAITIEPDIGGKSLTDQFHKLLLQPLCKMQQNNNQISKKLVVIDALDECEGDRDIRLILRLLPQLQGHLYIFLTSRPELPIRLGFKEDIENDRHQNFILHEIPRPVIEHDISLFLTDRLSKIRKERELPSDWPGHNAQILVSISVPLFIFAATMCRIFEDHQWDPRDSLREILAHRNDWSNLDNTYLPILNRLVIGQSAARKERLIEEYRKLISIIIMLESPLSISSLSRLIGLEKTLVDRRLNSLHSVLHIPSNPALPVRLFHLSFRDFLLDKDTHRKTLFGVDEKVVHKALATHCVCLMRRKLRKNICRLASYGTELREIDPQSISNYLPSELQYSCRYWAQHLAQYKDPSIQMEAFSFLKEHLLHWVEAMSILGLASEIVGIIKTLQNDIQDDSQSEMSEFLHDAKRFILKNRQIAEKAPLQIYYSGLIFTPRGAMIRREFDKILPSEILTLPKVSESWSAELQTLEGHSDLITSVAFSSDGQLLASSSGDRTVKIWDSATGTLRLTLEGHSDWVTSVAFSPDGQLLASASGDKTVKLWDPVIGDLRQNLEGHSDWVHFVTFSPDGLLLASASWDRTVKLWDQATGDLRHTLDGHSLPLTSVAFSLDGQLLASASRDKTVKLWNRATSTLRHTLEGHSDWVNSVAFSLNNQLLASASRDHTVKLWDSATGTLRQTLEGHSDWVTSLAFSLNGQLLASASGDKIVKLWDPTTGTVRQSLEGHSGLVSSVAFSLDGQLLASASQDKTVKLWDPVINTPQQTLEGHSDWVNNVAFSPDGQLLASISPDKTVKLWNPATGDLLQSLEAHSDWLQYLAFSPDGKLLASASVDGTVKLWNPVTGDLLQNLEGHSGCVQYLAFSPDGKLLASPSVDRTAKLWNTVTGDLLQSLESHSDWVNIVAFSSDCQLLASASRDKTVKLWDIATGILRQTLRGHLVSVTSVAFSLDGQLLASGDRTVKLWEPATGTLRQTLEGHSDWITSMAFSPDGQLLASASGDKTVKLWDTATGTLRQTLEVEEVHNMTFSKYGPYLHTNKGDFDIEPWYSNNTSKSFMADVKVHMPSRQWVALQNQKVLWLPPEYRPTCSDACNGTLALGHSFGLVSFIRFCT